MVVRIHTVSIKPIPYLIPVSDHGGIPPSAGPLGYTASSLPHRLLISLMTVRTVLTDLFQLLLEQPEKCNEEMEQH